MLAEGQSKHIPVDVNNIKVEVNNTDHTTEIIYQPVLYVDNANVKTENVITFKSEESFTCATCGICVKNGIELQQHILVHDVATTTNLDIKTKEILRPHGCHTCEKRFTCKAALKRHIMIHTGQ